MSVDFNENLSNVLDAEKKLTCASGKIAPFAYTQEAYDCNCAEGVTEYNYGNEQNIPFGDASTLQMSGTVLAKGLRSQASSFTRMSVNHFFGRASFNVNKLSDYMKTFLEQFLSFLESNCNEWSPTTNYVQNDVVYMMTTVNNAPAKRTFIADTASLNLPPVDNAGQLINTDKWTEVSGNVDSFRALSAEINSLTVNGISCFKGNMTADNDMTVHGNLYVDGTSYVVNEAQLQVSGDYQTLRNGAESGIGSGGYSGIVIENYNGEDKHSFIGVDSDGEVRVGKNAFTHSTVYTDISSFDGSWYEGLTRTLASAYPSHVFTAVTSVKLPDVAYNAIAGNQTVAGYYVLQNGTWYGNVTVSGGQFVIGNAVTDSDDIATLNVLTRNELVYYVTITDNELQGIGTNQPVLTRSETTDFANGDILMWCASEKKAVKITRPASTNSYLKATLTNGAVSYTWEAGLSVDNATCFNGCTYAQACSDIRSGLTSCTGTVTVADSTANSAIPVALCTGFTNVGKSNCCPLTYNPSTGVLSANTFCGNLPANYLTDANMVTVIPTSDGCIFRKNIFATSLAGQGYIQRFAIGMRRTCNSWGSLLLSVGCNDAGTDFYDYCFSNNGAIHGIASINAINLCGLPNIIRDVNIRACCSNATGVGTTQTWKFCGNDGYMYGNVCGNVCGMFRTSDNAGFATDMYGNFRHTNADGGSTWNILTCAGRSTFLVEYETGNTKIFGDLQAPNVCATCVNATCVNAPDPGSTASKVCNLVFQAYCTDANGAKTTQQMTFRGNTGTLYTDSCCDVFCAPHGKICSSTICTCFSHTCEGFICAWLEMHDMCTDRYGTLNMHAGETSTPECTLAKSFISVLTNTQVVSAIGYVRTSSCCGLPIDRIYRASNTLVCVGYFDSPSATSLSWFTLCCTNTNALSYHPVVRNMYAFIVD